MSDKRSINSGNKIIILDPLLSNFITGRMMTAMKYTGLFCRLLLVIALTFIPIAVFSDSHDTLTVFGFIDIHGSIELGYLLRAGELISGYSYGELKSRSIFSYDYKPYIDLGFYFTVAKVINAGGSIRSIFDMDDLVTYVPFLDKYTVFIELFLFEHLHIGFLHYCEHMSIPYFDFYNYSYLDTLDRSEEKLYVRIEF